MVWCVCWLQLDRKLFFLSVQGIILIQHKFVILFFSVWNNFHQEILILGPAVGKIFLPDVLQVNFSASLNKMRR